MKTNQLVSKSAIDILRMLNENPEMFPQMRKEIAFQINHIETEMDNLKSCENDVLFYTDFISYVRRNHYSVYCRAKENAIAIENLRESKSDED